MKARKGDVVLDTQLLANIFLLLILLSLSFFFSGSETAFFSLPRVVVERLRQASAIGRRVAGLLEEPNRLLVTILIGNLGANILISAVIGVWTLRLFEPLRYSTSLGSVTAILLTTTILLLFAEITPKTIAINNAERFSLSAAVPLRIFSKTVYPLLRVILFLTDSILHLLGVHETGSVVTEEELKALVAMSEEEGVLKSSERLMIHRIFEFGDIVVRDVFVPRTDIVRVKSDITVEELAAIMRETGHSRFPVYGTTIDDIKGIVYAKDLFPYFWRGQTNIPISRFIRPAYYVPETKKVRDLLREFQTGRMHMAIVVGEYGGTKGLVTLEDLIEEVVGEIFDEYDVRKRDLERLPDGTLRVNARLRLDDLSEILGVSVRTGDCDTVGGLVYELLEHVPAPGEYVEHAGFKFLVEEIKERRITSVRISPVPGAPGKSGGEVEL
ncbi:MAG: HlyC/CorC family transporter [Candidatus Hydrogenedentota bacterium]|nr:MAG: HlyC/CorC family transporter [Candidatus Hydrogenedentota bacterium]